MITISDEMLFWGGVTAAAVSAVLILLCILVYRLHRARLDVTLDDEYGRE